MARKMNMLGAVRVENETRPGLFADGGNLYLLVGPTGSKSWVYRYTFGGRRRDMGLGGFPSVRLPGARKAAAEAREQVKRGIDPLALRETAEAAAVLAHASRRTFKECAEAYIEAKKAEWSNEKHAAQWRNTLTTYAYPVIGTMPVDRIDTGHVLRVLDPIWRTKTETASRVRGRIESVLDYATFRKYRSGDNPARLKGHLENELPKRSKVMKVEHHEALPYPATGEFMRDLRAIGTPAARALEFTVLTAVRTTEAVAADWSEIDLEARVWVIPAGRMKARVEHRVPLSEAAVRVLVKQQADESRRSGYVFPGQRAGKSLSNMAMLVLLQKRMERVGLTVHGFRSTFRDWAGAETHYARDVIEKALAHTVKDKTEAAYWRDDLLDKRARLMEEWAGWCAVVRGQVVTLPMVAAAAG